MLYQGTQKILQVPILPTLSKPIQPGDKRPKDNTQSTYDNCRSSTDHFRVTFPKKRNINHPRTIEHSYTKDCRTLIQYSLELQTIKMQRGLQSKRSHSTNPKQNSRYNKIRQGLYHTPWPLDGTIKHASPEEPEKRNAVPPPGAASNMNYYRSVKDRRCED